ncbi:hypothetical protein U8P76_05805 [Rhizobium johnstonii]|nr:hypothetical protein U8P76_05805 [Rhizobium johnstonii]
MKAVLLLTAASLLPWLGSPSSSYSIDIAPFPRAMVLEAQFRVPRCNRATRVREAWSGLLELERVDNKIGALTESKLVLNGGFDPLTQTWRNRCSKDKSPRQARAFTDLKFFMIRKIVEANPDQDFPVNGLLSFNFDAFVSPNKHQTYGPTLQLIEFYNSQGLKIATVSVARITTPEVNCLVRTPRQRTHRFQLPQQDIWLWQEIKYMRVKAIGYDTDGYC